MFNLPDFYQDLRSHFDATVAAAEPTVAQELQRLRMAPFASDPALTLRPCPLLVVSMKPYGAPGLDYPFGWEERADTPGLHRWYDGGRGRSNFVQEADGLVRAVLEAMELRMEARFVPNTYANFYRAQDAKQLRAFGLEATDCIAFHRQILAVVEPEVILCIGNGPAPSAYALYRRLLGPAAERIISAAPRAKVKAFVADGRLIVGVPHLSYLRAEAVVPAVCSLIF